MTLRSIPLFRVFGITLEVHPTFFLLPLAVAIHAFQTRGWPGVLQDWWGVFLIYICVVLHEFGHALVARRFRVPVPAIILLPIGGLALLGRIPRNPLVEILIVVAGPLVNFVLAALFLSFLGHVPTRDVNPAHFTAPDLLGFLFIANLGLGLFNLLPAFPMDGGRLLRATLAYYFNYLRATYIALLTGRIVAVLGCLFAILYGRYPLALLFVFILVLGDLEYTQLRREESAPSRDGLF